MPHPRILAGILCGFALAGSAAAAEVPAAVLAPVPGRAAPSALPADWQRGAFMEIYVRGYADSNGDGIGDLQGLAGRLDYLQSLGVTGLWLMPITRSHDHDHGYATSDYRAIEPAYGTLADFDELLAQAHARGIGVVVDYVLNHSGRSHPLFLAAQADRRSPYRDWYLWRDEAPKGWKIFDKDPWNATPTGWYFSQFSAGMPDWNLQRPEVMAWHLDHLRFWLNRGVDGFRFDAVVHLVEKNAHATRDLPESMALMREAVRVVHSYPNRYAVCEATHEEKRWAGEEVCGGAFALWMGPNFGNAAKGSPEAVQVLAGYFANVSGGMATMASNHDLFAGERLWDQVRGDREAYKLAAAAYLLAPATPFVYYGEEVGMSAAPALDGDPRLRTPMSWSAQGFGGEARPFRALAGNVETQNLAAESARGDSLVDWYRGLLALRKAEPLLARGSYRDGRAQGLAWVSRRELDGREALVLFNFAREPAELAFESLRHARYRLAFASDGSELELAADAGGGAKLVLPARSLRVYLP